MKSFWKICDNKLGLRTAYIEGGEAILRKEIAKIVDFGISLFAFFLKEGL